MTVRVTERDVRMLVKCALCRWLTTDQLRRLYFPKASLNAVQKRLRKLADAGYLRSYREHPTAESLHAVGPKGKPLVEEKGVEVMAGSDVPGQGEHLRGVNEIRVGVEQATVPVGFFFAYWQLADLGWRYPVIPDAVFAVHAPERRVFITEYDRGTETLEKLVGKLRRYAEGLEGFPFEAVLIVTAERRRHDLLSRDMRTKAVSVPVLVASEEEVREAGLFETEFVELPGGMRRKILELRHAEPED
jgi:Replication-relaxation